MTLTSKFNGFIRCQVAFDENEPALLNATAVNGAGHGKVVVFGVGWECANLAADPVVAPTRRCLEPQDTYFKDLKKWLQSLPIALSEGRPCILEMRKGGELMDT